MSQDEKTALANAYGVRPEYMPDELTEPNTSNGFQFGLVTLLGGGALMQTPAQRAAEISRIYGVLPQYVQPVEENKSL